MNVDNPKSIEYYSILRQALIHFLDRSSADDHDELSSVDSGIKAVSDNNGYTVPSPLFSVELLVALLS